MSTLITKHRDGFAPGFTPVTTAGEADADTGISMGVLRLAAGGRHTVTLPGETAFLLMDGRIAGRAGDLCLRLVRTIFDARNSPPEVHLVLGEVVTLPGGWSSSPPHHHPQPEIYHYRFTHPQGFGHAELGDAVVKVRQYDTVRIPAGHDHAQCAAPGYGMYYSWVIRHLPGQPYDVPGFTAEHVWTMQPGAQYWEPSSDRKPTNKR